MRSTIHLVAARRLLAVRGSPCAGRARAGGSGSPARARPMRDGRGGARRSAARSPTARCAARRSRTSLGKQAARAAGLWLDLVRVPPSGTWKRRRADLYGPPRTGSAAAGPPSAPRPRADHLVAAISGFGPASAADIASFAGVPVAASSSRPLARLRSSARAEDGDELSTSPALRCPPRHRRPSRFLPIWDATLLVHARRTGSSPRSYGRGCSTKNPQSVADVPRRRRGRRDLALRRAGSLEPFDAARPRDPLGARDEAARLPPSTPRRAGSSARPPGRTRRRPRRPARAGRTARHSCAARPCGRRSAPSRSRSRGCRRGRAGGASTLTTVARPRTVCAATGSARLHARRERDAPSTMPPARNPGPR